MRTCTSVLSWQVCVDVCVQHDMYIYTSHAPCTGLGAGIVGVSALSLIANLIGNNCESGAFVYGSMSFADKIANGSAIMVAEVRKMCVCCVLCAVCCVLCALCCVLCAVLCDGVCVACDGCSCGCGMDMDASGADHPAQSKRYAHDHLCMLLT